MEKGIRRGLVRGVAGPFEGLFLGAGFLDYEETPSELVLERSGRIW